jgi:hypothetical protein
LKISYDELDDEDEEEESEEEDDTVNNRLDSIIEEADEEATEYQRSRSRGSRSSSAGMGREIAKPTGHIGKS